MYPQYTANNIREVSGTVTVKPDDFVLNVNTSAQAATINLMEISSPFPAIYTLNVVDASANAGTRNITIVAPAGFLINGSQQIVLSNDGASCKVEIQNATNYLGVTSTAGSSALTAIPVNNTVYVMKNGDDGTGLVQRFDKPFLTIAGARAAATTFFTSRSATARVRIVVESGTYTEDIILDEFIDYDLGDSVINGCITDNNIQFTASDDNTWTNIIYGAAKIYNQQTTGNVTAMLIYKPNTHILFYGDTLASAHDDGVVFLNGRGRLFVNKIYSESTTSSAHIAVEMAQGLTEALYTFSLVEIFNADIFNVTGSKACTIAFNGGANNKNQQLSLINCRVKCLSDVGSPTQDSPIGIGVVTASYGTIYLYNTVLYVGGASGKSIFVNNPNVGDAYYFHSNMTNITTGTNGGAVLNNVLSTTLTVNPAVVAGF